MGCYAVVKDVAILYDGHGGIFRTGREVQGARRCTAHAHSMLFFTQGTWK